MPLQQRFKTGNAYEVGDIVSYKKQAYEVLEVMDDGFLVIGRCGNCETEVSPKSIFLIRRIE